MSNKAKPKPQTADPKTVAGERGAPAVTAEQLRARVLAQRRHITGLTGKDPLRGGIDD